MISTQASVGFPLHVATLSTEMAVVVFSLSLLIGLTGYLFTNISPLGFVVPGSIVVALLEGPASLITMTAIAGVTWLAMKAIVRATNVHGRKMFALTLGVSTALGTVGFLTLHRIEPALFPGDALGFLVPGLVVFQLLRQNVGKSFAGSAVVTAISGAFALLMLAYPSGSTAPAKAEPVAQIATISSEMSVLIYSVSLLIGLTAYFFTNTSPLGFVVPGSIVVSLLEGPTSLITMTAVAGITWLLTKYVLRRQTILYGKRQFALTLGVSTLTGLLGYVFLGGVGVVFPGDALGFLVPGLVVYQVMRQPIAKSFGVTAVVTALTGSFALAMLAV